jgi:hypothetical protein
MLNRHLHRKTRQAWRRSMNAAAPSILNPKRLLAHIGFADWPARGIGYVRAMGPYAAIEILLPGGTVLALLFWWYRRYQRGEPLPAVIARAVFKMRLGIHRLAEAARSARRLGLGLRGVTASACTVCFRS